MRDVRDMPEEHSAPASRPRIIHITPRLDAKGGIASVVRTIVACGIADHYDLVVVETVGDGPAARRGAQSGAGIVRGMFVIATSPGAIVHLHVASGGSFRRKAVLARWARSLGHRVVVHVHGAQFDTYAMGGGDRRRRAVVELLSSADAVVVLSESWRERIATIAPPACVTVIPNAVSVPTVASRRERPLLALFSGRLGARKGVPELVAAIGTLQGRGADARWVLAGDGDLEQTLRGVGMLPDPSAVEVPGWISPDDMSHLLARASVFCLPSHNEGLPVALLEAMSWGLACVVTPIGGIPEVVVDGRNGLIVPVGDPEALSHALERLLRDPAYCARLGDVARTDVIERYGADAMARSLRLLYEGLVSGVREEELVERHPRSA